jgi:hypothetical protein
VSANPGGLIPELQALAAPLTVKLASLEFDQAALTEIINYFANVEKMANDATVLQEHLAATLAEARKRSIMVFTFAEQVDKERESTAKNLAALTTFVAILRGCEELLRTTYQKATTQFNEYLALMRDLSQQMSNVPHGSPPWQAAYQSAQKATEGMDRALQEFIDFLNKALIGQAKDMDAEVFPAEAVAPAPIS